MSQSMEGALACLECGEPIPGSRRWVCSARCAAVLALVRNGRRKEAEGWYLDPELLRRYRRRAGKPGIVGRFPTISQRQRVTERDHHHCQFPGCETGDAHEIDWRADDPDLNSLRADALRTLCSPHHRRESVRRFVAAGGQVAHTAPAIWARIEAANPLVPRDNQRLWDDPQNLRFLSQWPLASEESRRDLEDWVEALRDRPEGSHPVKDGDARDPDLDLLVQMNAAIDGLELPLRRQRRLVRAITAFLLRVRVVEPGV
jgi:predicted nucleic acid-binding Zn ribbon protein